ncbi:hypothetical protein [Candidatus Nanohalococcus occultus]|uniref:Uncharacterized protein n=1 Tax=Candidatus Nanohalococcus occultus TaxID=2978047 RepID=A0ABY8CEN1_9ARCH|nr:hypothetical protein SVXNc_0665 [Candidatus Nanohaloarchaeota archaeon SVXNc]
MLRPDPIGAFDLAIGVLMWFTVSPLPEVFATAHASVLIFKGVGTMLKFRVFPPGSGIVFGFADVMSAGILFVGQPPLLGGFKEIIALILFAKGGLMFTWILS